ncbi:MAG: DUF3526 domain-containing protein, partial [Rhodospirillaceae bacterium]
PAIMTQNALNAISGTGTERFADFVDQMLTFHENWRDFFTDRVLKGELMTSAEFEKIPAFEYETWTLSDAFKSAIGPAIGLALFVLILGAWSSRRYARYPVV